MQGIRDQPQNRNWFKNRNIKGDYMKEMFKSKVIWLFIIFILSITYINTGIQKNASADDTDKKLNNYEINSHQ